MPPPPPKPKNYVIGNGRPIIPEEKVSQTTYNNITHLSDAAL